MQDSLTFTAQVFKEGKQYVSFNPELEVASCGDTPEEAKRNLRAAIRAFLVTAEARGSLGEILAHAGYVRMKKSWRDPYLISLDRMSVAI